MTMDQAEYKIKQETDIKFPFRPENTQWFNIKPEDMEGGVSAAKQLMDLYGEVRADGIKRLYRLPVVFPDMSGGAEDFFKSQFSVPVGPVKYRSQYGDDGTRHCVYPEPIDPVAQAKRTKFTKRGLKIRGECEPQSCYEYGSGKCKFKGELHFYIPGMSGSGFFKMMTGSANASEDIFTRIQDLYTRLAGRLPKFTPDMRAVFSITKVLKQMVYFTPEGKESKSDQWVPSIETQIEMPKLLMLEERRKLELAAPVASPQVSMPQAWLANAVDGPVVRVTKVDSDGVIQNVTELDGQSSAKPQPQEIMPISKVISLQVNLANTPMGMFIDLTEKYDLGDELEVWADGKYGTGWDENEITVGKVHAEVTRMVERRGAEFAKAFIWLTSKLYVAKIPTKDLAIPYLQGKFDGLGTLESIKNAGHHLDELLAAGTAVAQVTMSGYLKKAA